MQIASFTLFYANGLAVMSQNGHCVANAPVSQEQTIINGDWIGAGQLNILSEGRKALMHADRLRRRDGSGAVTGLGNQSVTSHLSYRGFRGLLKYGLLYNRIRSTPLSWSTGGR